MTVRTFTELERSLTKRDSNIESMSDAFYPPNRQVSIAANVSYYISEGNLPDEQDLDMMSCDYAFRLAVSPFLKSFDLNCCNIYHSLCIKERLQV